MLQFNKYMNINRIEFTVTNACTSRCKHCSLGNISDKTKTSIDKNTAVSVVSELSRIFNIQSVMTFGGEPLLYADTTCAIHKTATENNIANRQIITNGYFAKSYEEVIAVAKLLKDTGVNSLLLSVDEFHQEHIPIDKVYCFAKALCAENISGFRLHPAWVVNREHNNKHNEETKKCIDYFADLHIPVSNGNNIFPSGNAAVYLSEYYENKQIDVNVKCGTMPYTQKLDNVETIAINPNGDVTVCCFVIGNLYNDSITEIVKRYNPYNNPIMNKLINGNVCELVDFAKEYGITIDTSKLHSACGVCREIVKRINT